MKTKYFLTALALPAVFAACSSEELEFANQNAALNDRIELQNVTFVTGGIESRLVQGDNNGDGKTDFNELLFQANDGMGACLIDVLAAPAEPDPIERYHLTTNYVQSNYRYGYADGVWNSQANLVEGNYMFYMPYNASAQGRSAIVANLPAEQTLALDANGEYSTFADVVAKSVENGYPLVAGYKFLKAGDSNTQLDLTLQPIYAYPKFTLSNITGQDIVISSIEISAGGNEFELVKPFNFAAATNATAYAEADQDNDSFVDCFFDAASDNGGKNGHWSVAAMNNTVAKSTEDILGTVAANGSNVITIAVDNYELAADAEFSFYAVLPAGEYADLTVKITSTEGTSAKFVYPACHLNPGKRYPVAEYTEAGTIATAGEVLTGIIAGLEVDNSVAVSDNNALLRAVAGFNPVVGAANSIDIRMTNQNVSITSALIGVLKNKTWSTNGTINFVSDVVIDNAGDWMESLPNNMTINFKKNVTVKGANNVVAVAETGANVNFAANSKLTIASGAVATVKGTAATLSVENNGTANILEALSVKSVANKSTMNLAADLTTTAGTVNTKDIVVKADATVAGTLTNGNDQQVAATLTVNKADGTGATVTLTAADLINKKKASVTNYGIIASANLSNSGTVTNGASNNVNAKITATNGSNAGTVDNYAELTVNENTGTINMKSFMGKATVSAAATWGTIENTVGATVTATSDGQYIWKTITGGETTWPAAVSGSFNSVKFVGVNVTASSVANNLAQVTFEGGSLKNSGTTTAMPAVFNVYGETTIEGAGSIDFAASANINVAENAVLNIVGQSLTIGASTLNIGKNATVNSNADVTAVTGGDIHATAVWNKANE